MKTTQQPHTFAIDPRDLAADRATAQTILPSIDATDLRVLITDAALALLIEHKGATKADAARLAHVLWDRVRYVTFRNRLAETFWITRTPGMELNGLLEFLLDVGDLRATLLTRRAQIDAALARLQPLEASR